LLLACISVVTVTTVVIAARALWQRFHAEERIDISDGVNTAIEAEHVARYEFAKQFCVGKAVADIASGTGFGSKMLRTVAASVDGYDREELGQEFVIDLERQSWPKHYDVIVSFETIEHLSNPEFFLHNARRTAKTVLISTPLNERLGWANPHHKQVWTDQSFRQLVDKFFTCEYYHQRGNQITPAPAPDRLANSILAVCL
jgi:2-polyprenyl-3-methyl-5-hydroxy-6-metoxy-1,4-benzoquinol methylase